MIRVDGSAQDVELAVRSHGPDAKAEEVLRPLTTVVAAAIVATLLNRLGVLISADILTEQLRIQGGVLCKEIVDSGAIGEADVNLRIESSIEDHLDA